MGTATKVTQEIIAQVRELASHHLSLRSIAKATNLSHETIRTIIREYHIPHKLNRTCQYCHKPISKYQRAYCSHTCRLLARFRIRKQKINYTPMSMPVICRGCGIPFIRTTIMQKYCPDCQKIRAHTPLSHPVPCKACGSIFVRSKPAQRYCPHCQITRTHEPQRTYPN